MIDLLQVLALLLASIGVLLANLAVRRLERRNRRLTRRVDALEARAFRVRTQPCQGDLSAVVADEVAKALSASHRVSL